MRNTGIYKKKAATKLRKLKKNESFVIPWKPDMAETQNDSKSRVTG